MRSAATPVHGAHRLTLLVLVAVALAVGATVGLCWMAGYGAVAHRLLHPHWIWLPIALGAEVVAYFGYVLAYRGVACAEDGAELELPRAAALVATGFGVFVVAGGFALDEKALERSGLTKRDARERVLGLATLEYAVLAPAAAVAAGLALSQDGVSLSLTLPWLVAVPVGAVVALALVAKRNAVSGRKGWRARLAAALGALALILRMAARPTQHGLAFLGIALYWLGDIACLWSTLHVVFAHTPPVAQLVVGYASGYALTRRTLPLGGAGLVETLLPLSLGWVGIALAPAVLAVAGYRFLNLWLPMVPALLGLPTLRRLERGHSGAA
jgi:Lysylphosphatidylglycerol synthase TM region